MLHSMGLVATSRNRSWYSLTRVLGPDGPAIVVEDGRLEGSEQLDGCSLYAVNDIPFYPHSHSTAHIHRHPRGLVYPLQTFTSHPTAQPFTARLTALRAGEAQGREVDEVGGGARRRPEPPCRPLHHLPRRPRQTQRRPLCAQPTSITQPATQLQGHQALDDLPPSTQIGRRAASSTTRTPSLSKAHFGQRDHPRRREYP